MAARKEPAAIVVAFFETAPLDTATTLLAVCKDILARRQVKPPKVVRAVARVRELDPTHSAVTGQVTPS